jgi:hypothetical protein
VHATSFHSLWLQNSNCRSLLLYGAHHQWSSHHYSKALARLRWTSEAWASPCGICCGQSDAGTGFSPSSSVPPCQHHSIGVPYSYVTWWPQFRDIALHHRHEK